MTERFIYMMRHAKSSWKHAVADLDRPLTKRGQTAAPLMGQRLAQRGLALDALICSPALRSLRTAQAVAVTMGFPTENVRIQPHLYTDNAMDIIRVLAGLDDALNTVLLVCHNPSLNTLINQLSDQPIANIPSCGVVKLVTEVPHWQELHTDRIKLLDFDYPKRGS